MKKTIRKFVSVYAERKSARESYVWWTEKEFCIHVVPATIKKFHLILHLFSQMPTFQDQITNITWQTQTEKYFTHGMLAAIEKKSHYPAFLLGS